MNLFKKIWIVVTGLIPNRQLTDEKVVSTVEKVWENSKEKNEVVDIIQSIDDKESKAKIISTIKQIEKEIKTLEERKERINLCLAEITEFEITGGNFAEIDKSLNKINQLIKSKTTITNTNFFQADSQKIDRLLRNNELLRKFKDREIAIKKKEELHKKQVREKLTKIETMVGQGKLDDSKLLLAQINKEIKNSYKHELERLKRVQQKLKDKELQILIKQQEEAQRKTDEEAKRLKEIIEKRQQEERKRKEQEEREEKERLDRLRKQREVEDRIREERQREESKKRREKEEKERQEKAELESLLIKKSNWQEFQQILQNNSITTFYHFTDQANLKSIKEHGGLYSWHYCDRKNIIIPYSGGDSLSRQLDIRYNLQDFVRLSFCDDHPMMYRLKKENRSLVLLQVRIDVAYFKNTCFSDINATDGDHIHGSSLQDLINIDFRAVKRNRVRKDDADFKTHQAEVLVKTWIPIDYITNINYF